MGASVFAYLLAVSTHELGHYIANTILGVSERRVVLHPFDLSYNIGDVDPGLSLAASGHGAFYGAAGPVLNLILGVSVGLTVWRRRSSTWLPVVMWGPVALLQESVGMIIGLVDYPEVASDWVRVMLAGVPPAVIWLLSAALLVAGVIWMLLVLPVAGISSEDAYWTKVVTFLAGIPMLLLGAVAYLMLVGSSSAAPEGMVLQNRTIALGASVALVMVVAAIHQPLFTGLERISHTEPASVGGRDAVLAVGLGAAVFVFQLLFFN